AAGARDPALSRGRGPPPRSRGADPGRQPDARVLHRDTPADGARPACRRHPRIRAQHRRVRRHHQLRIEPAGTDPDPAARLLQLDPAARRRRGRLPPHTDLARALARGAARLGAVVASALGAARQFRMIEVDVQKRLGDFALAAEFTAPGAGITALFGRSGAGKTTLVNALAGLVRPDRGRIAIEGEVLFSAAERIDRRPERRRLGYVFQEGRLFPHYSVRGNLGYGMRRGKPRDPALAFQAVVGF